MLYIIIEVVLLNLLFVLALCSSAGDADREMERLFKEETEIIHSERKIDYV